MFQLLWGARGVTFAGELCYGGPTSVLEQVGKFSPGAFYVTQPDLSPLSVLSVDLQGDAEWMPFDAPSLVGESLRFVSGDPEGNRFRARYFRNDKGELRARIWFGPETEGPPGHAHGGSIAAVLDEVLGLAAWTAGYPIVVGNLNVSFRSLLPLQQVVTVETDIISAEGRKVMVHGRICSGDTVYAEGECLCITIPGR
ncbi:MAG TPA: PaaI family thioesterase [Geobacterales bacterium]|nr:PaaI family thioesterase [Geobacterales bacterium]